MVTVLNWETIDQYQSSYANIPDRITYNRFHKCVLEDKILYPKYFRFQVGHSAEHAIIQLDDRIFEAFENNLFTLDMFIDYSKSLWKSRSHGIAWKARIKYYKSKQPQLDKKLSVKHEAMYWNRLHNQN